MKKGLLLFIFIILFILVGCNSNLLVSSIVSDADVELITIFTNTHTSVLHERDNINRYYAMIKKAEIMQIPHEEKENLKKILVTDNTIYVYFHNKEDVISNILIDTEQNIFLFFDQRKGIDNVKVYKFSDVKKLTEIINETKEILENGTITNNIS